MSFDYTAHGITPNARAILELLYGGHGSFSGFCEAIYAGNKGWIDRLAALRVRLPHALTPGETYRTRRHMLDLSELSDAYMNNEEEERLISDAAEGAYLGQEFVYPPEDDVLPFRTWHITSHARTKDSWDIDGLRDLTWFYAVDAQGRMRHSHAIVDLAHPRTKAWLVEALNLNEDDKVSSVWSSIGAAKAYLDRQSLGSREVGSITHEIFVSGRRPWLWSMEDRMRAWQQGEMSYYTRFDDNNGAFFEGIGVHPSVRYMDNIDEARTAAHTEARGGTNKVFEISYLNSLAPYTSRSPPKYKGEETIVINQMPRNWSLQSQKWIRSARDVFVVLRGDRVSMIE